MTISQLTTQEFIDKLRNAPQWTLTKSLANEGLFELRVVEDDEVKTYLSPNPVDLSDLGYRMFLAGLRKIVGEATEEPMRIPVVDPRDIKDVRHAEERKFRLDDMEWRHNDGKDRWEYGRVLGFSEQWVCDAFVGDEVITDVSNPGQLATILFAKLGSVPPPLQEYFAEG
jgi:hypothetical protein